MSTRQIAFLHAFPCDGTMWAPQVQAVTEAGWHAVAPDLPGFGGSALPDDEPDLDVVADQIAAMLREQGPATWTIAGVSLGGYVAMNLLRRHRALIDTVVLCDTKATPDGQEARTNRARLASACEDPQADIARILEQAVLPSLVGPTTHESRPAVVAQVESWLRSADGPSVAWYQRAMARRPDSRKVLGEFAGPALVLWGDEDALSPAAEQASMVRELSDVSEVVIPRAGHLANVEEPAAVSAAIVGFLTRIAEGF